MPRILLISILLLLTVTILQAKKPPVDRMKGPAKQQFETPKPASNLIRFYQKYISPIDGDRCPMYPGCSSYMAEAVAKHGLVKGILMGTDRLMRCGRNLESYPWIIIGNSYFVYDPVEDE